MKSLKELQDEFQRGILAEDDAILADVNDSGKEERKVLFGVYRHAYVARLAEIVDEDYEQVHAYIGDQAFARLVKAYIAAHPSDQRNARWFSRHLPAFIASLRPTLSTRRSPSSLRWRRRSQMLSTGPTVRR
ncbi:MAG TPA: DNA-binding domain-containing protein [Methyloceanibacter sp.]|nr:DNA-binding domain-containing protein [Methyloceanibacter sp.]